MYFRQVADPENDAISEYFHVFWLLFSRHCFGAQISAIFVIVDVLWGLHWGTVGSHVGVIFRVFEKGAPPRIRECQRGGISAPQGELKDAT